MRVLLLPGLTALPDDAGLQGLPSGRGSTTSRRGSRRSRHSARRGGSISKDGAEIRGELAPLLRNGILAFSSLPLELRRLCASTGATALRMFWHVRLPAALPQLFVGFKGAAVNATVGATIAEWIGGDAGLGYYIQIATGDLRMDLAFAIIMVLALLGLALFGAVALVERLLLPWHVSQRLPPTAA